MDLELLINLVQERKALWDTSSKAYHNRDVARKLWAEIAGIMNIESGVAKSKWSNLRDMFRKEHLKQLKKPTGSEAVNVPSWKFYEQMKFISDVFKPRKMITNMPSISEGHSSDLPVPSDNIEEDDADDETIMEQSQSHEQSNPTTIQGSSNYTPSTGALKKPVAIAKKKLSKSDTITQLLALEKKKILHLEEIKNASAFTSKEEQDEDYYFAMSLLPHLRAVPMKRKLAMRTRIMQVLIEEDVQDSADSSLLSSSSASTPQYYQLTPNSGADGCLRSFLGEWSEGV